MISTSEFMHATPADFASHDPSRKSYDSISEQIIFNNLDVILRIPVKTATDSGR
jgi:alkaline phosphatase